MIYSEGLTTKITHNTHHNHNHLPHSKNPKEISPNNGGNQPNNTHTNQNHHNHKDPNTTSKHIKQDHQTHRRHTIHTEERARPRCQADFLPTLLHTKTATSLHPANHPNMPSSSHPIHESNTCTGSQVSAPEPPTNRHNYILTREELRREIASVLSQVLHTYSLSNTLQQISGKH
ncbi:uncharacterized histidine-rich protein DDB_G0274557-like [Macrobrachium nipponense]|uniref:uncharacterized histidine-rich protein DDB_G0274557-like n=1 Tax=Macrobrachium nipponense TaxID=159736 RepID=UPI0030C7DD2F